MTPASDRIHFIDLMRGFAVVIMVMGHSIDAVLNPESRATSVFQIYNFFRGFTAPIFLFVSGLAFIVSTQKRWDEYIEWTPRLRQRVLRAVSLFAIGYALHLPFFSLEKIITTATSVEIARLLQADVLHCVAASLLILHGIIVLVRTKKSFIIWTTSLALMIMLATPVLWSADLSRFVTPLFSPYLNQQQLSVFPLFPYAAFLLIGAALGHFFLQAREHGKESIFFQRLMLVAAVLAGGTMLIDLVPVEVYPVHNFWKTSPLFFSLKLAVVFLLTTAFFFMRNLPGLLRRELTVLGQSSLLIYATHIAVVYGSAANPGLLQSIGRTLTPAGALVAGLIVLLTMLALVHGWNYLRARHLPQSRYLQAGLAGTIIFLLLIRPY